MARVQQQTLDSSIPTTVPMAPIRHRSTFPSLYAETMHRLQRSTTALCGLGMVLVLVLVALLTDVLAPYSPILNDPTATFQPPSWHHVLVADQLVRVRLSRVISGCRVSLAVVLASVLLAVCIGLPLGLLAGFYRGRLDTAIMRAMDLILSFPVFLLAIVIMIMFTPTAGLIGAMKVIMAIGIVRIPIYARLVRGSVLSIKEKEYIEACRAVGQCDRR